MNFKPFIKPILNNLPFLYDTFGLGTGGTTTAEYCYSVWLRHLVRAYDAGFEIPQVVAELGPGDSLGVGLAALLSGASEYYALDAVKYAGSERNIEILNNLVHLFEDKMPVPDDREFPEVRPRLPDYAFPKTIITPENLEKAMKPERVKAIRAILRNEALTSESGITLKYFVPWDDSKVVEKNSVDMIVAQAVMEHVVNVQHTYRAVYAWLKPGGLFSQHIDFRSHNFTYQWNGHWAVGDLMWRIMAGTAGMGDQPRAFVAPYRTDARSRT